MLNEKLEAVARAIEYQITHVFPVPYLEETFSGKITLQDVVLQIIVECCKRAYDQTQETHSLDYYLGGAKSADVNERMVHQRTMDYIRERRKIQDESLKSAGWYIEGLTPKEMKNISDKLKGHNLNSFQFWEVRNVHDMLLVKAVVERRIGKGNFTAQKMQEYSNDYDSFFIKYASDWGGDKKEPIFDFLVLFTLEWKYSFEFYFKVADKMLEAGISRPSHIKERIG